MNTDQVLCLGTFSREPTQQSGIADRVSIGRGADRVRVRIRERISMSGTNREIFGSCTTSSTMLRARVRVREAR